MTQARITPEDLYHLITLSDPRFGPDGLSVAYVRTEIDRATNGYKSAIWIVSTTDGGRLRQFTSGDKRDSAPRWSPDGRWLAFVSDRGDDKAKPQVYLIPTDGGEARRLTTMVNGAGEPAWSPDGARIAFTSRLDAEEMATGSGTEPDTPLDPDERQRRDEERDRREVKKSDPRVIRRFGYRAGTTYHDDRTAHLFVVEVDPETGQAAGRPCRLTEDERNYSEPRWLPDGSALLATVDRQPGSDDLFYYPDVVRLSLDGGRLSLDGGRVPPDGGEPQVLTGPEMADINPWPSPDGRWIAYNSLPADQLNTANGEIVRIPAAGGEPQVLTAELDAHARDLRWLPDGQGLCFLVSEQGRIDLRYVSVDGGPAATLVTGDCEILAYDISPGGTRAAYVASTDRTPSDLYVAELNPTPQGSSDPQSSANAIQRLTQVNDCWLASRDLAPVEDLWFESGDGTPIQGWVLKPPGFEPAHRYPMVLSIHGGPHVMWSRHEPTMWHEWQVLAAAGYVVFACNPRGSDGYGRDFRASLVNRWGEADLPDLLAGVERVVAGGYADPERLVITGGSYGGFMTAWVIGHDDRFKAAVAQRGVYDLLSFSGTTDIPRFTEREFASTPWEDPQKLWRYSPLAHVDQIHTPLLLIHSENDFRAPIPTAEGLFVALRRLERNVEMVRYPRDGHELSRSGEPKHRVDRLERILAWFDRYVQEPSLERQATSD